MIAMAWRHEILYTGCKAYSPKYWPRIFVRYINSYGQDKGIVGAEFTATDSARTTEEVRALKLGPAVRQKLLRDDVRSVYGIA